MRRLGCVLAVSGLIACGGTTPPDTPDEVDDTADIGGPAPVRKDPNAPGIQAEIGALDGDAVRAISDGLRGEVEKCYASANAGMDLPLVYGDVEVSFRVKGDGSVRWAYMSHSDVGDVAVERCILDLIAAQTWPEPEGGEEGLARATFGRDPEGRAPTDWSASELGPAMGTLSSKLSACRSRCGAASISVTFYVDADGKPMAAGMASSDEKGLEGVDCATSAVTAISFPSPGSYPAKVTVKVP